MVVAHVLSKCHEFRDAHVLAVEVHRPQIELEQVLVHPVHQFRIVVERVEMILYPEQIILDAEIAMNVFDTFKAFDFKDLEEIKGVIRDVGPRGHYLREKHTRKHVRDFHYSPFFHQQGPDGKLREPRELAIEGFSQIYDSHHPEPLPDDALKEMDRILAAADRTVETLGE